jgi:transposase
VNVASERVDKPGTSAGRRRFNVLGALNAITHELVMVTNDTYITADSVCELLRRIAKLNLAMPITLVLDNARYQKCNIVTALALQLNIELLYLPTYSPNLNLIERLWKFVKKKVPLLRLVWVGHHPVTVPTVTKPAVVAPQASWARSGGRAAQCGQRVDEWGQAGGNSPHRSR